jgi:hypothetical protein
MRTAKSHGKMDIEVSLIIPAIAGIMRDMLFKKVI